ncbi:MAG: hypothetical protein VXY77_04215 [Pseudomonadota bacterium]|nr:hypothetical protein [Pseudomonadota bacterium]
MWPDQSTDVNDGKLVMNRDKHHELKEIGHHIQNQIHTLLIEKDSDIVVHF